MEKIFKESFAVIILSCLIFQPGITYALPELDAVSDGSATFSSTSDTLTVTQATDRLIADWKSFSIGEPETVSFLQPASSSIALNRVIGGSPSNILGRLSANGRIFLINPNGIVFGVNAKVDTAGLLASTLNLSNTDFIAGNYNFTGPGGAVVNYGTLKTLNQPGGYVALLGSSVKNVGSIEANLGKVILAAGEELTLNLDPLGLISVVVNITKATNRNDNSEYAAVNNAGKITADGGKVILSADILDSVFTSAVNNDGIIQANTLEEKNGEVLLRSNQNIELNGTIEASGAIDALAQENIILGKTITPLKRLTFSWRYLSGSRAYKFKEFGYYYRDGQLLIPLAVSADINGPASGSGIGSLPGEPLGLYTIFDTTGGLLTYFQDAKLNPDAYLNPPDGINHVLLKNGTEYWWEDLFGLGDQDYNDAVIDFRTTLETINPAPALLNASNIFLTAQNGYILQESGEVLANNLMLAANTGMSGTGSNGGIATEVNNLSSVNQASGDIQVSNKGALTIADLSGVAGLNSGVTGSDGITNNAVGGEVNIETKGSLGADLIVDAPVDSYGPVVFNAQGNIVHNADGDVIIRYKTDLPLPAPELLASTSHVVGLEYVDPLDRTVDVEWGLPETIRDYGFTGNAEGAYTMMPGSEILSGGGNIDITANQDVSLALLDARNARVNVTSTGADIVDNDLGVAPQDFDVIAHTIKFSAAGSVGGAGAGEEIDLGHAYGFSHLWDNADNTNTDSSVDSYSASFNAGTGEWSYTVSSGALADGKWWFHVATIDGAASSATSHLGPFIFSSLIIPPPPTPDNTEYWENIEKELRVYYEILSPSLFLSYEPATKIGLYAYHPLTPTDLSAFDNIKLDVGAYEFIDGNINVRRPAPYFGLIGSEEKNTKNRKSWF